ncbi:nitroreductase/quinone reductase family protein [Herbiconiux sp. VKM Ac-2851]|uniref:nitroreductase/quinone reductase family protein n=1 Tax=Herbiconiux sp. VKM Ac-2851 TaxID=2739025 RepID=UPI001564042D|nr:nitroreductase/quinone reductase family protein [Herbiconiux sp. VKM Ac-2851]NQX34076.1 nitroreductase family deazaflavin-dependent oxidoreductase [Herbiconiux sp. VKM Ac-2851]
MRRRLLWLLKNTLNRLTTRIAASGRGPFSLVRHVGRKTGRVYQTPIIVAAVPEGFIAELTYGDNVNWYRNIVAAGGCELVVAGVTRNVISVENYPEDAGRRAFPFAQRLILQVLHRHEFRLLRTTGNSE